MKKFVMAAVAGTLVGVVAATQIAGPLLAQENLNKSSVYEQLDLFGDIFERIRAQYVEEVDESKLIEAAINGMLTSLDPHSSYMSPKDAAAIESSGAFQGVYHVLGGRIAPLDGIDPEDLTIAPLLKRVRQDGVREVIMATNPTVEGDGTALYITNLLAEYHVRVTRLARGIASGSVLEFANREMLSDAMRGRQEF